MVAPDVAFAATQPHGARMATCPECEFDEIDTEDFEEGDSLSCPECGKNLVLLGNDELDFVDDDDDDEDLEDEDDEVEEDADADEDDEEDEEDEELDE